MLKRIISGGQTGVDRGALDAALRLAFPCGGSCPPGRKAEDGPIDRRYPVVELDRGGYAERTRRNVADSDGTLIVHFGRIAGGTRLTLEACREQAKPLEVLDATELCVDRAAELAADFVRRHEIRTLNVAGPRESRAPTACRYVDDLITRLIRARTFRAP